MRLASSLGVVTAIVGLAFVGSCGEGNPGIDPPPDEMAFPNGLLLDPRVPVAALGPCMVDDDCGAGALCGGGGQCRQSSRWLFVTNANSDRRYNAASLLALDLDAYWAAAFEDPESVRPAGSKLSRAQPCRRVANLPQVIECTEEPFIEADATIHFGNFPGPTAAWDKDTSDGEAMLLIPVRGDPSITYTELSGGLGQANDIHFECGQASDPDGGRKCDDDHRLRFLRNDPEAKRLAREPFRILVSPQPELPYAYISHQGDQDVTLMDLDGLQVGGDGRPAIVHQANLLLNGLSNAGSIQGGFGLAQRPCDVASQNAPTSTLDCTRPLVYSSIRWQLALQSFTAISYEPLDGQTCVGPDQLGTIGGIICEPQAEPIARIGFTGLSTAGFGLSTSRPLTGDIAFSRTGNELYVVQSNPGAIVRIDTSIGFGGQPLDVDVAVVEVCSQPTTMVIYDDGDNEYGLVTCYRSAEVFIVDLAALTVVGLTRAGIGPDAMTVDVSRQVVYVANSLDATISIIDMGRTSTSRFTEVGRIGLQEPYTQ